MPITNSTRAIVASATIALLAGCSGGSSLAPTGSPSLQNHAKALSQVHNAMHVGNPFTARNDVFAKVGERHGVNPNFHAVIPDKTKKPPKVKGVFVSDYEGGPSYTGEVYEFSPASKKGSIVETISDSVNPQGLDGDAAGNLYVAATSSFEINIYAPGATTATSSLSDSGGYPVSVAYCPNGTIYAANIFNSSFGPGNIEIYAPGSTSPTGVVPDSNIDSARFIDCDSSSNLYYDYLDDSGYTAVAEYSAGGSITEFGSLGIGFPGGVRVGSDGDLYVSDQYVGVEEFSLPTPGSPIATVGGFGDPVSFSLKKGDKDIWVADASNEALYEASFPKGKIAATLGSGTLILPIDSFVFPAGSE
jgi:hypothetical protein